MNYFHLRTYLKKLNYVYFDNCSNNYCNFCKLIKIKKKLNKNDINKRFDEIFHIIHTNLVLITVFDFKKKRYYVTFIDDYIK